MWWIENTHNVNAPLHVLRFGEGRKWQADIVGLLATLFQVLTHGGARVEPVGV